MLKKKLLSSYTNPTIEAIDAITSRNFPETLPVGSYVYRIQKYPGDIDIREDLYAVDGDAIGTLVQMIQEIVRQIQQDKNSYFADFKAGTDSQFGISMDTVRPEQMIVWLKMLHDDRRITDDEYINMKELVVHDPSEQQQDLLKDAVRAKYILRWTPDEILQGYKVLSGGRIKMLADAIQEPEIIKIDTWSWLDGRFVELSNFLILFANGERTNIEQGDYIESMKHDLTKYLSAHYYNPFKALKRMWVLAVAFGDHEKLDKLNPLINSNTSILYQVVSDLKALKDMVKVIEKPPYSKMSKEVEAMKRRLSNTNVDDSIFYLLEDISSLMGDEDYESDRKYTPILSMLSHIIARMSSIMNTEAMDYAMDNNLIPISGRYLETPGII